MAASRKAAVAAAAGIGLLTTGCVAGQTSPTRHQASSVGGSNDQVGPIQLSDVQFYPAGAPGTPSREYYKRGDDVTVIAQITNRADVGDRLEKISSPEFGGVTYHGAHRIGADSTLVTGVSQDGGSVAGRHTPSAAAPGSSTARITMNNLRLKRFYSGLTIPVTFSFAKAGSITISVPMGAPRGTGQPAPPPGKPGSRS
jgi:hypothetical protein